MTLHHYIVTSCVPVNLTGRSPLVTCFIHHYLVTSCVPVISNILIPSTTLVVYSDPRCLVMRILLITDEFGGIDFVQVKGLVEEYVSGRTLGSIGTPNSDQRRNLHICPQVQVFFKGIMSEQCFGKFRIGKFYFKRYDKCSNLIVLSPSPPHE